ncbi:MAG: Maf family protein [Limisphaerales bacterium]|jgi:septum formation protein
MNPDPHPLARSQPLPPIVLASQSPRRMSLLRELVPEFRVNPSDATELHDTQMGIRRLCEVNAELKAFPVARQFPDHLVIGADTLVFLDDEALGKPTDLDDARRMLRRLSGRIHQVITGVCLLQASTRRMRRFSDATHVRFRVLEESDITGYLERVQVLDKAGAYALQEEGHRIVESVEGSRTNVIGLPVESLRRELESW